MSNLCAAVARAGYDATRTDSMRAASAPMAAWRLLAALRLAAEPPVQSVHLWAEHVKCELR